MDVPKKTIEDAGFKGIFTEVSHPESLGLVNDCHLRLFQLDISDSRFTFHALKEYLQNNIGSYIFSRSRLQQYEDEGKIKSIVFKAIQRMRKHFSNESDWMGEELGDLMLYVFLEQMLDAPKIFSKFDVDNNNQLTSGSSGIHLLNLNTNVPSFQLVFGKSRIAGDPREAIDNAFVTLEAIKNDSDRDIRLVESTAFDKPFNKEQADFLSNLILPNPNINFKVRKNTAFGVFLGYDIGFGDEVYTPDQLEQAIKLKMQRDIKEHVNYILRKIKSADMEKYSFYMYFLPFNDVSIEKTQVMASILED